MKQLLVLLLVLVTVVGWGQCDVTIIPGSVQVIDNNPGVQFQFDIQNNGATPYNGGSLYLGFGDLAGGVDIDPVWDFTLTEPLLPGNSLFIETPLLDIPTPSNVMEWPFWNPFGPSEWSPGSYDFYLYLDGCLFSQYQFINNIIIIDDTCPNNNSDQFCDLDCDLGLNTFNENEFEVEVFGDECYNINEYPFTPGINTFVVNFSFGNIPCGNINYTGFPTMYEGDIGYFDFYTYGIGNIPCADTIPIAFEENCKIQLGLSNNPNQVIGIDYNPSNNSVITGTELDCELNFTIDAAIDTLTFIDLFGCNENINEVFGYPEVSVINFGNEPITELCIKVQALGQTNDTLCFNNLNILPGDTAYFSGFSPFTDATVSVHLLNINGENTLNEFGFDDIIPNNMGVFTAVFTCYGCTDPTAINYNPYADVEQNPSNCVYDMDVYGCMDPLANNYNPDATLDDGSCTYDIPGCTDPNAYNFNPQATVDDGSCEYHVLGCTDEDALNYDDSATLDDGSCEYPAPYDPCDDVNISAPNVFTPNNDGVNDAWYVVTDKECWKEWHVAVYNRWGSLVWESFNPDDKWNGSNNGSTHFVADGVYVYTIIANNWNSDATTLSGHITIFR